MGQTLTVTLSAPSLSTLTLTCQTAVYPYVGREIEREIIEVVYRDGSSAEPEDAATRLLLPRPYSPVGEPLSMGIPFATAEISEWVLSLGESADAEATVGDGYGSRVYRVYRVRSVPRTDVPGRYDCSIDLRRIS